jgi:hypothetical protein
MILTRIDGKTCNAITLSSAQICYIRSTKPKEMNHLENILKKEADFTLVWLIHAPCFLHVSYGLEFKENGEQGKKIRKR